MSLKKGAIDYLDEDKKQTIEPEEEISNLDAQSSMTLDNESRLSSCSNINKGMKLWQFLFILLNCFVFLNEFVLNH